MPGLIHIIPVLDTIRFIDGSLPLLIFSGILIGYIVILLLPEAVLCSLSDYQRIL